jgi:hypothetical protein
VPNRKKQNWTSVWHVIIETLNTENR